MSAIARLLLPRALPLGIVAVLLRGAPAWALDPDRTLAQLHHTAWTAEDGAPSQISALAQTTDGYLWIGSARGLFRFDGIEFERYVAPDTVALPSHNIYALLATPGGGLWVSFRPAGLGFIQGGRLRIYVQPDEAPTAQTYQFALDHDGEVWAGTHDGLVRFDGTRWVSIGPQWKLATSRVRTLFVDAVGTLWISDANGLHSLERGATEFQTNESPLGWIYRMVQDKAGRYWMSGRHPTTALAIANGRGRAVASIETRAIQLMIDRDGCLWLAPTDAKGLRRVRAPDRINPDLAAAELDRIESMREADGLSGDAVYAFLEDREGSIWAGTPKGLDRFRHSHFVPVALPEGHETVTLLAAEGGHVWVGSSTKKPLLRVSVDAIETLPASTSVASVYRDGDGVLWWGGFDKILRHERDTFQLFQRPASAAGEWIWEVFRGDTQGALNASVGDSGLYRFRDGLWERRPPTPGLPTRGPSASYHAPDGSIWLGYTENRVCVLDADQVTAYTPDDGIEIGRVRVIRGRGPHYWVGGELGLSLYKDGRFRTVHCLGDGPFGTVSGIVERNDGSLWLNEMRGVIQITAEEVARLLVDPAHAVSFRRYGVQEGLKGGGQMNWTCSTAVEATDGHLWFATDGGLAWIDPQRIQLNELPPPVIIRSIETEAGKFDSSGENRLPSGTATLRIDYTALSLTIPEQVRFRYRLEGFDPNWVDAGARRTAFYTRLRPGPYRFQVAAANNDGIWSTTDASTAFSVAPAFYQTRWFGAACLLAILGTLWLAYALRVRSIASRLQRLHDERVDERMRIAHELHDTLLQGFLSASMQLHVAHDAIPAESPANAQVGRVLNLMNGVIGEARNTVGGLRSDPGTPELERALSRIHQEFAGSTSVDFRVVVNGRTRALEPQARDEVYRIGRECLTNAFRHAGARRVEVEVDYLPGELRVVVRDDGRGIDPEVLRAGRAGHFGLSGMRERAKRIGAVLTLRSRPGAGTELELVLPGGIAFAGANSGGALRRAAHWARTFFALGQRKEA